MLNVFSLDSGGIRGRLIQIEINTPEELLQCHPIWVDLESPSPDEKAWINTRFDLSIPENAVDEVTELTGLVLDGC